MILRRWVSARGAQALGIAGLVILCSCFQAAAQEPGSAPKRFLVVYESDSSLSANIGIAQGIDAALSAALPDGREMYTEFRDITQFPDDIHAANLAKSMAAKYRTRPPDVVLAAGPGALTFVLEHREQFAPGVPVVFGAITEATLAEVDVPADVTGVVSQFDIAGTIELARKLHPQATRVVVITGSATFDRNWRNRAEAVLKDNYAGLDVNYVGELTLEAFKDVARDVESDAILLILTIFQDAEGKKFIPREAAAQIAGTAAAPSYAVYSSFVGQGVVGGSVETFEAIGTQMADLAAQLVTGNHTVSAAATKSTLARPMVDWQQIKRWGIDPSLVPTSAIRLNYEPTAWERYKGMILLGVAIVLIQSGTITALFVQNYRRVRMEKERALERQELAHLSRASQLGELSGALAHELNQPLTAILANAEAGVVLLAKDELDRQELGEILADIISDDRRAAAIISQLRRLMLKGEAELEVVDLNQLVSATLSMIRSEFVSRQTTVEFRPSDCELCVSASTAQLQQIILNLTLNAAEAMATIPASNRRVIVETRLAEKGWCELIVSDFGLGLSRDAQEAVFRPFISTKPNGLGFGLSICRTIARAHAGTLKFDDTVKEGARIVLALPTL